MVRPPSPAVTRAAADIGGQFAAWRKLLGLTSKQVAERAGIGRGTLVKIEGGDASVSFGAVLRVARALGFLDALVEATDPYETDLGRAQADRILPKRVR